MRVRIEMVDRGGVRRGLDEVNGPYMAQGESGDKGG